VYKNKFNKSFLLFFNILYLVFIDAFDLRICNKIIDNLIRGSSKLHSAAVSASDKNLQIHLLGLIGENHQLAVVDKKWHKNRFHIPGLSKSEHLGVLQVIVGYSFCYKSAGDTTVDVKLFIQF